MTNLFSKSSDKVGLLILWRVDCKSRGKTPYFGFSSLHLDTLLLLLFVVDEVGCRTKGGFLNDSRREELGQVWKCDLEKVGKCLVPARQLVVELADLRTDHCSSSAGSGTCACCGLSGSGVGTRISPCALDSSAVNRATPG